MEVSAPTHKVNPPPSSTAIKHAEVFIRISLKGELLSAHRTAEGAKKREAIYTGIGGIESINWIVQMELEE